MVKNSVVHALGSAVHACILYRPASDEYHLWYTRKMHLKKNQKRCYMKKLICVILVMVFILSSCGVADPDNDLHNGGSNGSISFDDDTNTEIDIKTYPWRSNVCSISSGLYQCVERWGIPREDPLYYCTPVNTTYTDYSTLQTVYLCSVPGCVHNDSSCTSYMEHNVRLVPDYNEEHIILIYAGTTEKDITSEIQLASVSIMDLNGSNRKEILRLKAQEEIDELSDLFIDNHNHMYFVVKRPGRWEIRQLDMITGVCETLFTSESGLFCRHGYRDNLIIEYWDGPVEELFKCYCVSTGEITGNIITPNEYGGCMTSFSHYYMGYNRGNVDDPDITEVDLAVFDYDTGEMVKLIKGLPCAQGKSPMISMFDKTKFEWTYLHEKPPVNVDANGKSYESGGTTYYGYIVDLETGSCTENILRYQYRDSESKPVPVIAETGDGRLVVTTGTSTRWLTLTDYKGIPHVLQVDDYPEYSLITVEDYCAGRPNYQPIEDKVYIQEG